MNETRAAKNKGCVKMTDTFWRAMYLWESDVISGRVPRTGKEPFPSFNCYDIQFSDKICVEKYITNDKFC